MIPDKIWHKAKRPPQPVQQAQTVMPLRADNPVVALRIRNEPEPMIALDFCGHLRYILPGYRLFHLIQLTERYQGDRGFRKIKQ